MQWKMARRSRLAAGLHEWAMRWGFPLLVKFAPIVPRRLLFFGARVVITLVMAVYSRPKGEIDRNLRRVLGSEASRSRVRRTRRHMIYNLAYYWVDLFRFCQLPYERSRKILAGLEGLEHLDRVMEEGRGVVLLTGHLGNWELGGIFLREQELPVSVVYVPDQSPTAEKFRAFLRSRINIEEIPIDPAAELSSLPVLRALREGRAVAMQGDRDFNDQGEMLPFFGEPAPFPPGPILLARLTGAVIVPTFIVYTENHDLAIHFDEPIEVERTADRSADVSRALARWVEVLEGAVRRWPEQWYTFFDFWAQRSRSRDAGEGRTGEAGADAAGDGRFGSAAARAGRGPSGRAPGGDEPGGNGEREAV